MNKLAHIAIGGLLSLSILACQASKHDKADPLQQILSSGDSTLTAILNNADIYEIQILYTQVDRDQDNRPILTSYSHRLDESIYFYPASTVKMPIAFLALQRLNELSQEVSPKINMHSRMALGARTTPQTSMDIDSSAPDMYPQVAHFIEQIYSVSDNEAYNRLYEFLGQDYINTELRQKGVFKSSRIRTRVGVGGFDTEANRYTNPVSLMIDDSTILYKQDEQYAIINDYDTIYGSHKGLGYHDDELDSLILQPFDMSEKNFITLPDLEACLRRIIFPELFTANQRFNLSPEQYQFLYKTMPKTPLEFSFHQNTDFEYYDSYVKFFVNGDSKEPIPSHIKIFNKVGWAYGTLTDCSYIIDTKHGVEFFLTATIYTNKNQIFNDGQYEYKEVGLPFFASLGAAVYSYELQRQRPNIPDFSSFNIN